jgi:hypothetical protein
MTEVEPRSAERRYYEYAGLRVASEVPLPEWAAFERAAPAGDPDVVISLSRDPDERAATAVERRFAIPKIGSFRVSNGSRIIVTPAEGVAPRQFRPWLIGSAWGSLCYQRGLLLLHASAVMVNDEAVLFCAPAKGGKSTMAAQLNGRGYALVSDDLCHLDISADGTPRVHPAAPRLKLWSDALQQLGWSQGNAEPDPARAGKYHLSEIAHTRMQPAAVREIYVLEWGEFGVSRLSGLTALQRFLAASTYRPGFLDSAEQLSQYSRQSLSVLQRVPIWELRRPRDLAATEKTLASLASRWAGHRMINE